MGLSHRSTDRKVHDLGESQSEARATEGPRAMGHRPEAGGSTVA